MSKLKDKKAISTKRKLLGNVALLLLLLFVGYVSWGYKHFEQKVGPSPHEADLNIYENKDVRTRMEKLKANRKSVELGFPSTPWEHRLIDFYKDNLRQHDLSNTLFGMQEYVEKFMSEEERVEWEKKKNSLIIESEKKGEPITAQEVWLIEDLEGELEVKDLPLNMFGLRALEEQ